MLYMRDKTMQKLVTLLISTAVLMSFVLPAEAGELFLYAGAGLRKPVDQIITRFERETGNTVIVTYGGSGKQMNRYLVVKQGDLFMPGSYFYIDKLRKKKLVLSHEPVALHTPVIAVNKKGKHAIKTLKDMAAPGVKLAMGDPKAMALGRTSIEIIKKAGLEKQILRNVAVYGATVNQLTLYVVEGAVDAAIIGRANAIMHRESLDMFEIPADLYLPEVIGIAVLATAKDPSLAEDFQKFVTGPAGIEQFKHYGFFPVTQ
jgi:molybdate transport system substrate-binding protein